jgi:protoporphyrinogen oxidase
MAARLRRPPETGSAVRKVLWRERKAVVGGAGTVQYSALVSTMPLPELLGMLEPKVGAMEQARRALKWIGVVCINYLVRRPGEIRRHWVYVPERRYSLFRVGFPANINPGDAPAGRGIVSAEVSYLPGRRPPVDSMVARAARDLRALGLLGPVRDLEGVLAVDMPYAYVLFDRNYRAARRAALGFLARHGIIGIGRYGNWNYGGMEDAIREGGEAASLVNAYGARAGDRFPAGRD